jgi:hypothetical protein
VTEEKEAGRKRRASGGREGSRALANGSVKNGREAERETPKPHAKGGAVSRTANKKRRLGGITDAVRDVVREMPVLPVLAAFAAGILIGFRPGRR